MLMELLPSGAFPSRGSDDLHQGTHEAKASELILTAGISLVRERGNMRRLKWVPAFGPSSCDQQCGDGDQRRRAMSCAYSHRRSLRDVVIDALRRCRRKHIWRACHTHHKRLGWRQRLNVSNIPSCLIAQTHVHCAVSMSSTVALTTRGFFRCRMTPRPGLLAPRSGLLCCTSACGPMPLAWRWRWVPWM